MNVLSVYSLRIASIKSRSIQRLDRPKWGGGGGIGCPPPPPPHSNVFSCACSFNSDEVNALGSYRKKLFIKT
jgi:hypothetical protein